MNKQLNQLSEVIQKRTMILRCRDERTLFIWEASKLKWVNMGVLSNESE